jgi:hypothetical protein
LRNFHLGADGGAIIRHVQRGVALFKGFGYFLCNSFPDVPRFGDVRREFFHESVFRPRIGAALVEILSVGLFLRELKLKDARPASNYSG